MCVRALRAALVCTTATKIKANIRSSAKNLQTNRDPFRMIVEMWELVVWFLILVFFSSLFLFILHGRGQLMVISCGCVAILCMCICRCSDNKSSKNK